MFVNDTKNNWINTMTPGKWFFKIKVRIRSFKMFPLLSSIFKSALPHPQGEVHPLNEWLNANHETHLRRFRWTCDFFSSRFLLFYGFWVGGLSTLWRGSAHHVVHRLQQAKMNSATIFKLVPDSLMLSPYTLWVIDTVKSTSADYNRSAPAIHLKADPIEYFSCDHFQSMNISQHIHPQIECLKQ